MGESLEPGPVIMRYQGKKQRLCRYEIFQSPYRSGMEGRKRVNALHKSSSHHTKPNSIHIWCSRKYTNLDIPLQIYWKLGYVLKTMQTERTRIWILDLHVQCEWPGAIYYSFKFIICKMKVMKQHTWKGPAYIVSIENICFESGNQVFTQGKTAYYVPNRARNIMLRPQISQDQLLGKHQEKKIEVCPWAENTLCKFI